MVRSCPVSLSRFSTIKWSARYPSRPGVVAVVRRPPGLPVPHDLRGNRLDLGWSPDHSSTPADVLHAGELHALVPPKLVDDLNQPFQALRGRPERRTSSHPVPQRGHRQRHRICVLLSPPAHDHHLVDELVLGELLAARHPPAEALPWPCPLASCSEQQYLVDHCLRTLDRACARSILELFLRAGVRPALRRRPRPDDPVSLRPVGTVISPRRTRAPLSGGSQGRSLDPPVRYYISELCVLPRRRARVGAFRNRACASGARATRSGSGRTCGWCRWRRGGRRPGRRRAARRGRAGV